MSSGPLAASMRRVDTRYHELYSTVKLVRGPFKGIRVMRHVRLVSTCVNDWFFLLSCLFKLNHCYGSFFFTFVAATSSETPPHDVSSWPGFPLNYFLPLPSPNYRTEINQRQRSSTSRCSTESACHLTPQNPRDGALGEKQH